MMKVLVIVESPTKAKVLSRILNRGVGVVHDVIATMGHFVDLPKERLGVYREGDEYFLDFVYLDESRRKFIEELKERVRENDYVHIYLATDPDREGEAISYQLYRELVGVVSEERIVRMRLNAITESEVFKAISRKERIDVNLVKAQFARRAIDRVIGYVLSPYYSRMLKGAVSVGRVQTLALYYIVERAREARRFVSEVFYYFHGKFYPVYFSGREKLFEARSVFLTERKVIGKVATVLRRTRGYGVEGISKRREVRHPPSSLTTASLQKVAFRRYGFLPGKTMKIAQGLYEKGHCTYVRTDSEWVSAEGCMLAKEFIERQFGEHYFNYEVLIKHDVYGEGARHGAHEAIRPLHFDVPSDLNDDEQRVFYLIKTHFLASFMKPALIDSVELRVVPFQFDPLHAEEVKKLLKSGKVRDAVSFWARGSKVVFDGYLRVMRDDFVSRNEQLFYFKEGQGLNGLVSMKKEMTKPKGLMSYDEVINELEGNGVGRPSTYASIFETLQKRGYVGKGKELVPTNLAEELIVQIERKEKERSRRGKGILLDAGFTARMEKKLDEVARGKLSPDIVMRELEERIKETYSMKDAVWKIEERGESKKSFVNMRVV